MYNVVVLPEIEFEALLEAWERFLDALLSSGDKGAMERVEHLEGATRMDDAASPRFTTGGSYGSAAKFD